MLQNTEENFNLWQFTGDCIALICPNNRSVVMIKGKVFVNITALASSQLCDFIIDQSLNIQ